MKKGYLVLQNGRVFEGELFGAEASAIGELVFNTSMCGYIETLTDPSFYGQIVLETFPLIGNYGIIESDCENKCALSGYVVREWCSAPSNFRAEKTLDEFLRENGVPAISGVDTREITKIIRDEGVMNAVITDTLPVNMDIDSYAVKDAVKSVSAEKTARYTAENGKYSVALIDYGVRNSLIRELLMRGCNVIVFPHSAAAEEIMAENPDGIVLSPGPGNPNENKAEIEVIRRLFGVVPMFGIGLGHQMLALAAGGETAKMKVGHRGANQPVGELSSGKIYITNQNHGYEVVSAGEGKISFANVNDKTIEGAEYPEKSAFSVQFYPQSSGDPHSTSFLYDRFIGLLGGER